MESDGTDISTSSRSNHDSCLEDSDQESCSSQHPDEEWEYDQGNQETVNHSNVVIIGSGPGGIGPIIRAARTGKLKDLLKKGCVWLDSRAPESFGSGNLGDYVINSNTSASVFSKVERHKTVACSTLTPFRALK